MIINYLNKINSKIKNCVYSIMYKDEPVVSFDSIQEVNYESNANVTTNPLENGNKLTEYKYNNPDTISLIGIIENSSILGKNVLKNNNKESILTTLQELKKDLIAVDIKTKSGTYKNFTLTRIHIPENYENYSLLVVEMSFEEILLIGSVNKDSKNESDSNTVQIGTVEANVL